MSDREEFSIPGLNPPISHYCDAVRFGNLLFISGMAALDENLHVIGGDDPAAQAEAVFQALERAPSQHPVRGQPSGRAGDEG
jgi:2-iminobutanoate/2-iminopropanoate deaminase